jgi:hypothetical protein
MKGRRASQVVSSHSCLLSLITDFTHLNTQGHKLRDRGPGTAAYPASSQLGDGEKWTEIVYSEVKIFCTGPTISAKAGQKSLVPIEPIKESPSHMSSLAPFCLSVKIVIRIRIQIHWPNWIQSHISCTVSLCVEAQGTVCTGTHTFCRCINNACLSYGLLEKIDLIKDYYRRCPNPPQNRFSGLLFLQSPLSTVSVTCCTKPIWNEGL